MRTVRYQTFGKVPFRFNPFYDSLDNNTSHPKITYPSWQPKHLVKKGLDE